MPDIYRVVTNYQKPFHTINTVGEQALRCKKIDLYRSIITVGNPSFMSLQAIKSYGFTRVLYESIIKKVAVVASNIQSDLKGIRRHPVFDSLVSDEKRIISYNLGMAFAKLYSEKLLNIPNLHHVESLKKQDAITFAPQVSRARSKEPDLVGQTLDAKWHVFEAKGLSSSESHLNSKIAEAKQQVRQVEKIHGLQPATGTACATYIGSDRILTYLDDPSGDDGKHMDIDNKKFFDAYYAPFLLAGKYLDRNSKREKIDGLDVEFYDLVEGGRKLSIGLDREILELIKSNRYNFSVDTLARLKSYSFLGDRDGRYSVGLDGFVVSYTDH